MENASRYVLPIQALTHDGKKVSLVILAERTTDRWEFSKDKSPAGCIQPAVLEWKEGSLLMMTSCEDGSRRVYWTNDEGSLWIEEYDSISRVWGNSLKRKGHGVQGGFVSATIGGQKVILVSRPVYSENGDKETGRLHLWLTDMQRIYDVGPISAEGENVAASTLLYVADKMPPSEGAEKKEENKLYCSYEFAAAEGDNYNIAFVDLTEKLEEMKKVVAAWKEKDAYIAKEYGCGNERKHKWRRVCGDVLTEGLVGFLSNKSSNSTWADEYLGVNATVNKGNPEADGGLTFKGPGAGVEWPVGKTGQNVPYHFANEKFTLVATVSIHAVPKESSKPIPLMGVRMNDTSSGVLFGLSYTHEKKWKVIFSDGLRKPLAYDVGVGWEPNRKHRVALELNRCGGLSAYVDGLPLYDTEYHKDKEDYNIPGRLKTLLSSHSVSHLYIGADSKSGSDDTHVTLSNVLLYNRALSLDKLKTLMKAEAAAAAARKVPVLNVANQTTIVREHSRQSVNGPVVRTEAQQDATSSPQSQRPPAQESELKGDPASSEHTSTDIIGSSTSADLGKVQEEANGGGVLAPASSPTPSASSREIPATEMPVRGENSEGGQEGKADGDISRNGKTDNLAPHATSPDVLKSVSNEPPTANTHAHTDVSKNSGPDSTLSSSSTASGETRNPSEYNATSKPLDTDVLPDYEDFNEYSAMALFADSTVQVCVSRVLLLLLLGLWGTAALC
ncbi:trans-sialidase, putative [Trypanosoma cruzi marinkellei]|uniref:Trans-sialidase, putative n=2 Tax=Trypanosoma cruzi marinkellei TaxID=85056 RepID=K2N6M9_TRYCR|nr:trans-sialidase, putative [Trypanosoma cruzi marinkellei]